MPGLLDGFDRSIKDAGIDIADHRLGKGDTHTHGHTRDTSIF
jgi:hypothetical protein